ncbi:MAG: NAD(P)H-hydrate dehydratase [Frankiaceae bacterium]
MRALHSVAEVRAAEAALMARLPEGALMQRAAAGLARRCAQLLGQVYGSPVVLLVGGGDNGGDALYAGARLAGRGARVHALLTGEKAHPGGLAALRRAGGRIGGDAAQLLVGADLVVDGVLGIGGRGGLREPAASWASAVASGRADVVAVDIPSGVDADSGRVDGVAVRADVTVTFGTRKPGLVVSPGASYAGIVECVDIGLELPDARLTMLDAQDVAARIPQADAGSNKYRRGVVGIVAGSETYTGAAVLATGGALRSGAGMVRYVGPPHPAEVVRHRWPEAVVTVTEEGADPTVAGQVQAWVVGPGLGTGEAAENVVAAVLRTDVPVLVDADGLTVLSRHREWLVGRSAPTLLTPHAGEFARLMRTERATVEADQLAWVTRAAAELGVTVLLKGAATLVADPSGRVRVNPTGTPWLATAGSGDVLSGGAGALLAGGLSPLDAGSCGAFLHGLAGQLAAGPGVSIVAADLVAQWPAAVAALR